MKSLPTLAAFIVTAALASACGFEHSRNVLVPTDISTNTGATPGTSVTPSLMGTWSEAPVIGGKGLSSLPTPNSCSAFQFTMTSQTASQASGSFTAQCPGDLTLAGTISGQLGAATIPMVITGVASAPGEARSEEHTSELQSLRHLVCRLLLE